MIRARREVFCLFLSGSAEQFGLAENSAGFFDEHSETSRFCDRLDCFLVVFSYCHLQDAP